VLQLVAIGPADWVLIGEPQITMYKTVYRRYSNFAFEDVSKPMKGSGKLGCIYEATVDRDGDLLGNQSIEIDIDPLEMGWTALTTDQINKLVGDLNISGLPSPLDNLATWLGGISSACTTTAIQYRAISQAINNTTLSSDVDIAMNSVIQAIGDSTTTSTVLGSVIQVLARAMFTYWTPSIPAQAPIDFINLRGTDKLLTLRLTDGVELRNGLNSYLAQQILIGDDSELAVLDLINKYTSQLHPISTNYGGNTLVQIIGSTLSIPSQFWTYDIFKSYQFIINNSGGAGIHVTATLLNLVLTRLSTELPLILFYNASLIMNTLTTINELYGNVVYVKRPGSAFSELATDANSNMAGSPGMWNNFTSANLKKFMLSDFYMQQDMGLTKQVTYVIDGVPQTSSLEDSSSYAHMIRDILSAYSGNQLGAVISGTGANYGGTFDSLMASFTDPWPTFVSSDYALSIPYLITRFGLSAFVNVDYHANDILYFDAILYYIADRYYHIFTDIVAADTNTSVADKNVLLGYGVGVRQSLITLITNYLFPLPFSQLASAVNAGASPFQPATVYTFFKTQCVTVVTIRAYWFSAAAQMQAYSGYSNMPGALGVILRSTLAIAHTETAYVSELPIINEPSNISQHPTGIPSATLGAQSYIVPFGTYTGVPYYPPMLYTELGTSGTGTGASTVSSNIITSPIQQYAVLDNLAVYWCSLSRLNSINYLDVYSNLLLDSDVINNQVGQFSAKLMLSFLSSLNTQYNISLENNPSALAMLISTNPAISHLRDAVGSVIGEIQATLINIKVKITNYTTNRPLLAVRNYTPDSALTFDTIANIAQSYTDVVDSILAANSIPDPGYISTFFSYIETFCYSVGELYNVINNALVTLPAPWKTNAIDLSLMNNFLASISPTSMLLNTPIQLSTIRDYLSYVFSIVPDGLSITHPAFPVLTDVTEVANIMDKRALDLDKTVINIKALITTVLATVSTGNKINYAWIKRIGHYIFEWIEVKIGGETWDRHTCDFLDIWYELTSSVAHDRGYAELIGDQSHIYTPSPGAKPRLRLIIPLRFWYCRHAGRFYPLIASQYSPVVIRCKLRNFSQCILAPSGAYPIIRDRLNRASAGEPSVRLRLQSKYVYLDSTERSWMASHRHEYLYEYVQQHDTVVLDSSTYDWDTGFQLRTYFQNPCKALVIQTRMRSMEFSNQWTSTGWHTKVINTLTTLPSQGLSFTTDGALASIPSTAILKSDDQLYVDRNIVEEAGLTEGLSIAQMGIKFNGVTRQNITAGQYYANASTMRGWQRAPRDGIYSWNIGLIPSVVYPTGVVNMSRIDDTTIDIKLDPALKNSIAAGDAVVVYVFSLAYGVMRCMSGMAGRAFNH
jgi:hypothetical protein